MSSTAASDARTSATAPRRSRGLVKDFAGRRRETVRALDGVDLDVDDRRVRLPRRCLGLRQVDAAEHRRRSRVGHRRCDRGRRRAGRRSRPRPGHGVPGVLAVPVEDGRRERRVRARARRHGRGRASPSGSTSCSASWSSPRSPTTSRSELSGGMRQRVAIARALAPAARRPPARRAVRRARRADEARRCRTSCCTVWQRTGVTILMVTHDVEEAIYLEPADLRDDVAAGTGRDRHRRAVRAGARARRQARRPLPRPASTRSRTCCRLAPRTPAS